MPTLRQHDPERPSMQLRRHIRAATGRERRRLLSYASAAYGTHVGNAAPWTYLIYRAGARVSSPHVVAFCKVDAPFRSRLCCMSPKL
jgi:hypothetical protein